MKPVSTIPEVEMPGSRAAIDTQQDFRKRSPLNAERDIVHLYVLKDSQRLQKYKKAVGGRYDGFTRF